MVKAQKDLKSNSNKNADNLLKSLFVFAEIHEFLPFVGFDFEKVKKANYLELYAIFTTAKLKEINKIV